MKIMNYIIIVILIVSMISPLFVIQEPVKAAGAGNHLLDYITVIDDGGTYNDVYYNGTYIYVARGTSGVSVYTFDGADFTLVDTNATTGQNYISIYANGTYIFAGTTAGQVHAFTFDGTNIEYKDNDSECIADPRGIFANESYVFAGLKDNGIFAYSFDGTTITYIDNSSSYDIGVLGIHGDDSYIFTGAGSDNLIMYTFDGTTLTEEDKKNLETGDSLGVFWNGTYVFECVSTSIIRAWTTDGSSLTKVATSTDGLDCCDVWASDDGLVYVAGGNDDACLYSFNGTVFTLENVTTFLGGCNAVFGGDDYVFFTSGGNGLRAFNRTDAEANNPPINSNPDPADTATDEELNPDLEITINDPEGNTMNQTFWTNATGTWTQIGWNNNSANATVSNSTSCFSSYSTKYWWSSNTTDGNGNWDNDTYSFTTKGEPPWGSWSEGWTISDSHTCSNTGYDYGNWSFSEHMAEGALEEEWIFANYSHWSVVDDSAWWGGNYTLTANTTNCNATFALLNDSGMNRSQIFGWVHTNDTETDALLPFIIFAYNNATSFDCVMWSSLELWMLHWNGTNFTDIPTGDAVVIPTTDATDLSDQWVEEGVYLTDEGNYFKLIYNALSGTVYFKWWGNGAFNEPVGWATQYQNDNLTYNYACKGFGAYDPSGRNTTMQYDLINIWQLNYTTNASAWINISGYNESRPHMEFPVIDLVEWTEEIMSYFNESELANLTSDDIRTIMKDNITNLMNMESRMFLISDLDSGQQNDTVYYYSCMFDNYTEFAPEEYDEWLHLHVQMCPEDAIGLIGEFGDIIVGIDIDNNRVWDVNDRIFWAYADDTDIIDVIVFNGNFVPIPSDVGVNIWSSNDNGPGNLHRYTGHLNYMMNIPLGELIKNNSEAINISDVFGLSIVTTTSGVTFITQDPCVWQNWNETTETPYLTEEDEFFDIYEYFYNCTGDGTGANETNLGRWGEGVIVGDFDFSGEIAYNASLEAELNTTYTSDPYEIVNLTINVTNNGAVTLTDIVVNMTWWNCSCSDLNMTFVDSNLDISNFTWFNDSCYLLINNTGMTLSQSEVWSFWIHINITNCSGVPYAEGDINMSVNATELDEEIELTGSDIPGFSFGLYASQVCVTYTTDATDVGGIANSVFTLIGIIMLVGAIMLIIGIVSKYNLF